MKIVLRSVVVSLSISIVFIASAFAFNSDPNKVDRNNRKSKAQRDYTAENATKPVSQGGYYGGHDTITAEAVNLKKQVHGNSNEFNRWADTALPGFRTGTHDEDSTIPSGVPIFGDEVIGPNGMGEWLDHFYNPDNGNGLFSNLFENAPNKANSQIVEAIKAACDSPWKGDFGRAPQSEKDKFYDRFGRAMHLLQDMSVPAHVKNGWSDLQYIHGLIGPQGFEQPVLERYVENNWGAIVSSQTFRSLVSAGNYSKGVYSLLTYLNIDSAMTNSAAKAKTEPDDVQVYDYLPVGEFQTFEKVLNQDRLKDTAEKQTAEAVLRTAGFVDAVYDRVKDGFPCDKQPPVPGGDHPDDSFDLSAWQEANTQSGMAGYDLLSFFMPFGLKKGNLSTLYAKQFIDVMAEAKAIPAPVSQETQDAVNARYRHIVDGLELRTIGTPDESPDIALLSTGFYLEMTGLINKHKEPVRLVGIGFSPSIVKNQPVLVIPSGGLTGMDKSEFFKTSLDHYVKAGGTLIVFAQQQGTDFSVLPVPQEPDDTFKMVGGYGWDQDQNCFTDAVFIKTWHQMLAGQSKNTPTLNVDGYFTQYPSVTAVILSRTANGQPALIMYEYGQGRVIVTTMYSDYAFAHSQASQEEIALVRDMLTWAKKPADLPEMACGGSATLSLDIANRLDGDSASVKVTILSPDRATVVSDQTVSATITAEGSTGLSVSYSAPASAPLGIYHADYVLLDGSGNILQPLTESDSGRFAIVQPPKAGTPDKDIWFSVTTPSQEVPFGGTFEYTFHVYNNTARTRNLTIKTDLWHTYRSRTFTITVDPGSEATLTASDLFYDSYFRYETLHSYLYDESNKPIGSHDLSFKSFDPWARIKVTAEKALYGAGETVNMGTDVATYGGFVGTLTTLILTPGRTVLYEETKPITGSSAHVDNTYVLPGHITAGFYTIQTMLSTSYGQGIALNATIFEVPVSQVSVTPNLPQALALGPNNITFAITNTGRTSVTTGVFHVSLQDPDGVIVYSGERDFTVAIKETAVITANFSISTLKFGNYVLSYSQSDGTQVGKTINLIIPNTAVFNIALDKPSYKVRETAGVTVTISNTGRFDISDGLLSLSFPDVNYSDSKSLTLPGGGSAVFVFSVPLPPTLMPGSHEVNVFFTLSSGSAASPQSAVLIIQNSALKIAYSGATTVSSGETIRLTIENTGGVDTEFVAEELAVSDEDGVQLYQGPVSGSILANESKSLVNIQIPSQAATCKAHLALRMRDLTTEAVTTFYKSFSIQGVSASLSSQTDKLVYLSTDSVEALSQITTGPQNISNGQLDLSISGIKPGFAHLLAKDWLALVAPGPVATDSHGFIYVIDYCYKEEQLAFAFQPLANGNEGSTGTDQKYCVKRFDRKMNFVNMWGVANDAIHAIAIGADDRLFLATNCLVERRTTDGQLIGRWGGWGTDIGQFQYISGIAVSPDGSIFVSDEAADRIQKFDGEGNFIAAWGSNGPDNGQLYNTQGIAIDRSGFVYAIEYGNHRVQKFDGNGNFITKWGLDEAGGGVLDPLRITISSEGRIYVLDSSNQIIMFDGNEGLIAKWGGSGNDDGQFVEPVSLAVGADNTVIVADSGSRSIQRFDGEGRFIAKRGVIGRKDGQFNGPVGVALGRDGSIYVSDHGNRRVQKFDGRGDFTSEWRGTGMENEDLGPPAGIATGPDGSVYVADPENYRIVRFSSDGGLISQWGSEGDGDGQFHSPAYIAVGPDGCVYVMEDSYGSPIQKFDREGNFITKWLTDINYGQGIAVGPDSYVYVADEFGSIMKLSSEGAVVAMWSSWGEGESLCPSAIAVAPDGTVYVGDRCNQVIVQFDSTGNYVASWGRNEFPGGWFWYPTGLAVSGDGRTVLVSDSKTGDVQKMTLSAKKTFFSTSLPITQSADMTESHNAHIGVLDVTGKLYLSAILRNGLGQRLAESTYPFYIAKENTVVMVSTDKKVYRPGEMVTVAGEVQNLTAVAANNMSVSIGHRTGAGTEAIAVFVCDVAANGTYPFTVTTQAGLDGSYGISATVIQNTGTVAEAFDNYLVSTPTIVATAEAPNAVGTDPFSITLDLMNTAQSDGQVTVDFDGQNQDVSVAAGKIVKLIYSPFTIDADREYTFVLSGDANQTITKTVRFGLSATFSATPAALYEEGRIALPIRLSNNGLLDETVALDIALDPGTTTQKTYSIPQSGTVYDTLLFDLPEGNYTLTLSSQSPQAVWSTPLFVRKETSSSLSPLTLTSGNGEILVTTDAVNNGSGSKT